MRNCRPSFPLALYDIDYVGIRDKQDDWWVKGTLPEDPTLSKAIVDASRKHPMALWMMTGQSVGKMYARAPWSMVGPKWTAWSASYVNRAMALQPAAAGITGPARDMIDALKAGTDDASRAALWDKAKAAGDKVQSSCGDAPETAAVLELATQATRLSALAGKYDEAYANLKALPLTTSVGYVDVLLPKLMQHILATGNAEEGRRLRDALITPALFEAISKRQDYERGAINDGLANFMFWGCGRPGQGARCAEAQQRSRVEACPQFIASENLARHRHPRGIFGRPKRSCCAPHGPATTPADACPSRPRQRPCWRP